MKTRIAWTALIVVAAAGLARAATIRVPQDHATIQAAVNAAADGDTIEIKGGKYAEDVVVGNLTNLTIVGKGKVTLQPTGTGLTANNCTNLTIQKLNSDGGVGGFDFQDCTSVLLERFSVKNVTSDGVHAAGCANVRVIRGKITNVGGDGISFANGEPGRPVKTGEISLVKISDCGDDGVDILGSDIQVSSTKVKNVEDDCFEADIEGEGRISFDKCKAANAGDEGFELFADVSIVTNSKVVKVGDDGFDVEGDGSRLTNCKASRAESSGLEIEGADNVSFVNCKSTKSGDSGVAVMESSDCLIDGCKAIGSGDDGFYLGPDTSRITLRNNKAAKSRRHDLDDESGGANTIEASNKFKKIDDNLN